MIDGPPLYNLRDPATHDFIEFAFNKQGVLKDYGARRAFSVWQCYPAIVYPLIVDPNFKIWATMIYANQPCVVESAVCL